MMVYLWIRFEWIYGLAAVIAVFHDTIITYWDCFSLSNKEIDLTVVAAVAYACRILDERYNRRLRPDPGKTQRP